MSVPNPSSVVDVSNLSFTLPHPPSYIPLPSDPPKPPILKNITLQLPKGSRCLLIGANGAGKSTILQILSGKRLVKDCERCQVYGKDVFFKTPPGLTYLGTEWASNPVVRSDLSVEHFLSSIGGERYRERRDRLLEILDVDPLWRMHQISDGERRRVQIVAGLMPGDWRLLLLDEVTVDLDVLVRTRLISFLISETLPRSGAAPDVTAKDSSAVINSAISTSPFSGATTRQEPATIIYATHIYDGLDGFPTHVAHMRLGELLEVIPWPPKEPIDPSGMGSNLFNLALRWLAEDHDYRLRIEREGGLRQRGAKNPVPPPQIKEGETPEEAQERKAEEARRFFNKYDYSN